MNKKIFNTLVGVAAGLLATGTAVASSVSYYLDESNTTSLFPNNTDYLQVTIDDLGLANDKIYFTVTPLAPLTSIAGSHFRIDKFAFNGPKLSQSNIALDGWSLSNNKNVSIFGKFNNLLSGGGKSHSSSLTFSVNAGNDTVESYAAALSDGSAFFAAHMAGFNISCSNGASVDERNNKQFSERRSSSEGHGSNCGCPTSAYFGGSTSLVPPTSTVPLPPTVWLLGSGLLGLVGTARKRNTVKFS